MREKFTRHTLAFQGDNIVKSVDNLVPHFWETPSQVTD
jgi:hypothetical protein